MGGPGVLRAVHTLSSISVRESGGKGGGWKKWNGNEAGGLLVFNVLVGGPARLRGCTIQPGCHLGMRALVIYNSINTSIDLPPKSILSTYSCVWPQWGGNVGLLGNPGARQATLCTRGVKYIDC